jgi:hypothetical protein
MLGLNRTTLIYKLKLLDIERKDYVGVRALDAQDDVQHGSSSPQIDRSAEPQSDEV